MGFAPERPFVAAVWRLPLIACSFYKYVSYFY
jgi:hypothetical protein